MKSPLFFLFILLFFACYSSIDKGKAKTTQTTYSNSINTENYELFLTSNEPKGVLILFPGFPETPEQIKQEFKIVSPALSKGVAVVLMKFNQRLWLETQEKFRLTSIINQFLTANNLDSAKIYIGGFSSGGNISLLIANHLMETENIFQPTGVFIIDSPIDLLGLYEISQRNIQRNFSDFSVNESSRTIQLFERNFGKPNDGIEKFEQYSIYTKKTNNISNLAHLKDVKIRLYTEPDTTWWKENRQNNYEDMNAFYIKNLADKLKEKFGNQVEYISTENRGYRANGQRHPHSWSIVDIEELLKWVLVE